MAAATRLPANGQVRLKRQLGYFSNNFSPIGLKIMVRMYSVSIRHDDGSQSHVIARWHEFESARQLASTLANRPDATAGIVYYGTEPVYVCYPQR